MMQLTAMAPEFELPDFHGQTVKLSAFRHRQHVLLVLNRGFI
jgi:peroxiredoxin